MPGRCPNDGEPLVPARSEVGLRRRCPRCSGAAVGLPVARRLIDPALIRSLWQRAFAGVAAAARACPDCGRPMREVSARDGVGPLVEVCTTCHLLWTDAGELAALPAPAPSASIPRPLSAEAKRAAALLEVAALREVADGQGDIRFSQTWGEWLLAVLGVPMSASGSEPRGPFDVTHVLVVLVSVLAGAALLDLDAWVSRLALIPSQPWRHGGLTLLGSFVLHGDVLHLVGNMYFWLLFGHEIEKALGPLRYVLLLLSAVLLGDLLHVALDLRADVPVIGASGGISGLIAYHALRFPRARLLVPFRLLWIRTSAAVWLAVWVLLQLLSLADQIVGQGSVSVLAHLGGAAAGLLWWLATRPERPLTALG